MRRRAARALLIPLLVAGGAACSDDELALSDRLVTVADLPDGFERSLEVGDTVTTFCAGQDPTAGLTASEREVTGFARNPPGASVIHVVLRFEGDEAERFVQEADRLLDACSDVPDISGLAFTYEPLNDELTEILAGADAATGRYGASVGSAQLTTNVAVLRSGDTGELVAVIALAEDRAYVDALAADAFAAAVERLGSG